MMKFETVAASHLKSNPKAFYSYMNSKRIKIKAVISGIKDSDGNTLFNAEDIANELGIFLESTFVSETLDDMPTFERENNSFEDISDIIFTSTDVKFHLERLNVSKSVGPDKIHPKILKALAGNDASYDSGKIPSVWKNAYVTALHKKEDKSMASNYRPISLTCILAKVFEKILRNLKPYFIFCCTDDS